MKLEVLLSCMNQDDTSIVQTSGITGDVLVINQTNAEATLEKQDNQQLIRMVSTRERGLSRSRNLAIRFAAGDICLLCDDDEHLAENYEAVICGAFRSLPDADIIAFGVRNKVTRLKPTVQKIGILGCLKLASYQIAFRRESVMRSKIQFDPFMGAGSGNGCGEENKFLLDCLHSGMKIYYCPSVIATVEPVSSTWFSGYDRTFFYQRGGATRHMLGTFPAILYGLYYLACKRKLYGKTISTRYAAAELFRGIWEDPIGHQIKEEGERRG